MTTPPPDWPRVDLCDCERFRLWYAEEHEWCVCAHARDEHLDGRGTCTATRPTVDPEAYCHRCLGPNVVWSAPSPLWNAVMRDTDDGSDAYDGIVCPVCFAQIAETMAVAGPGWYLTADDVRAELPTHTRDGRVWDDAARLWVDQSSCPKCGGNWTMTGGDASAIRCADVWHTTRFPLGTAKVRITPIGDPQ